MKKSKSVLNGNNVMESGIHPVIDQLDFTRLKHKMMVNDDGPAWSFEHCESGEREYKRFLSLIKMNAGIELVPTKEMDKFWHQHILDTVAYQKDCKQVFGYFLHHFPYFGINGQQDKENLSKTFEITKAIYKSTFNEDIENPQASRCQDHACHVESSCACRVEGACKNC